MDVLFASMVSMEDFGAQSIYAVVRDVDAAGTYAGVPARALRAGGGR